MVLHSVSTFNLGSERYFIPASEGALKTLVSMFPSLDGGVRYRNIVSLFRNHGRSCTLHRTLLCIECIGRGDCTRCDCSAFIERSVGVRCLTATGPLVCTPCAPRYANVPICFRATALFLLLRSRTAFLQIEKPSSMQSHPNRI